MRVAQWACQAESLKLLGFSEVTARQGLPGGTEREASMTIVTGLGAVGTIRAAPRRVGLAGFMVPSEAAEGVVTAQAVSMPSLLALQEAGQEAVRDREARRHGEAMLDALGELQRALLGGAPAEGIAALAGLLRRAPVPADPRLAAIQRALLVRAAVEVARGRAAASV